MIINSGSELRIGDSVHGVMFPPPPILTSSTVHRYITSINMNIHQCEAGLRRNDWPHPNM